MKKKQILGAALALIVLGHSCKNDDYRDVEPAQNGQVQFTSTINGSVGTRVTGNAWDANDAIGVFMKTGTGLSNVLAANKKYTTAGNGNFSGEGAEIINYPETGTVDFIAYYPYSASVSGTTLPVSVADQTNQAAVDVLYSNNATGLSKSSATANLGFDHKLTKVELTVKAGNGVANVDGLKVAFNEVNTTASLDLATGAITDAAAPKNVDAKVTEQTGSQLVEAILLPGDFAAKKVVFTVGDQTFTWTIPASTTFEAGKKNTYDIQLQTSSSGNEAAVVGSGTITDWVTVPGGSVNVDVDENGGGTDPGTGTEETIYSETFGENGPTGNPRGRMDSYDDFDATTVKYSDLYTEAFADIRSTAKINSHVWLPATKTTGIKIEEIVATGYKNLKLSYDIAANKDGVSTGVIKVKVNNVEKTVTETLGTSNTYSTLTIEGIDAADKLTIEFSADATANEAGYRLDNIKLVGTK